jgi:transcriptional regulator
VACKPRICHLSSTPSAALYAVTWPAPTRNGAISSRKVEVMAIFQGAHGYISPRWYKTELAVPTWNYLAVHVYGAPRVIEDDEEVAKLLENLVAKHEGGFEKPWKLEAPDEWQANLRAAIVGFEMKISRIEGKAKMSQNRPAHDVEGVIEGLQSSGQNELAMWVRQLNQIS